LYYYTVDLGGFELVVDKESDVVWSRHENNEKRQPDLFPQHDPRHRRPQLAQATDGGQHSSAGALTQHVDATAALERPDVTQLAEEHVAHEVAPEADGNVVLGEQAPVADEDVVLREFGAEARADRHLVGHVQNELAKLGESALVAQVEIVPPLCRNDIRRSTTFKVFMRRSARNFRPITRISYCLSIVARTRIGLTEQKWFQLLLELSRYQGVSLN